MAHEGHDHEHDHDHGPHPRPEHAHDHRVKADHHLPHVHGGHSHTAEAHKAHAPTTVAAFVVTSSDTRTPHTDESGKLIRDLLEGAGHTVCGHRVVPDEPAALRALVDEAAASGARALIINGGTGISRRDQVIETLRPMLEKELPGFGELFRSLSYKEIGSPAMMSRALAGTCRGMIVFAIPGSPNAVRLAMGALILPELGHAVRELTRQA
ncbi:MAG: molybdenum cofactor biosynthesis protein B [Myxococcaceae bacterium]